MKVFVLPTGYLETDAAGIVAGESAPIRLPVLCFLLQTPEHNLLFDTGCHPDAMRGYWSEKDHPFLPPRADGGGAVGKPACGLRAPPGGHRHRRALAHAFRPHRRAIPLPRRTGIRPARGLCGRASARAHPPRPLYARRILQGRPRPGAERLYPAGRGHRAVPRRGGRAAARAYPGAHGAGRAPRGRRHAAPAGLRIHRGQLWPARPPHRERRQLGGLSCLYRQAARLAGAAPRKNHFCTRLGAGANPQVRAGLLRLSAKKEPSRRKAPFSMLFMYNPFVHRSLRARTLLPACFQGDMPSRAPFAVFRKSASRPGVPSPLRSRLACLFGRAPRRFLFPPPKYIDENHRRKNHAAAHQRVGCDALSKKHPPQNRRKQDVRVGIDAHLARIRQLIRIGEADLPQHAEDADEQQIEELLPRRPHELPCQKHRGHHRGDAHRPEVQNDAKRVRLALQIPHEGIGKAGRQRAQQRHHDRVHVGMELGVGHDKRAAKRQQQRRDLDLGDFFLQKQRRKGCNEEGRQAA